MDLEKRWANLWRSSHASCVARTFAALRQHYEENGRAYHNFGHIEQCLAQLDRLKLSFHPLAVEVALWYHDVIYDTHRKDNEERSAAFALDQMNNELDVHASFGLRVADLILATKHDKHVDCTEEQTIADIDLVTLAASPQEYKAYAAAIRREYSWVPEPDYIKGRTAVLTSFLDRPHIYYTDHFRLFYEQFARRNMVEEIRRLNA